MLSPLSFCSVKHSLSVIYHLDGEVFALVQVDRYGHKVRQRAHFTGSMILVQNCPSHLEQSGFKLCRHGPLFIANGSFAISNRWQLFCADTWRCLSVCSKFFVWIFSHVYTHAHSRMHTHACTLTCTRTHASTHARTHARTHVPPLTPPIRPQSQARARTQSRNHAQAQARTHARARAHAHKHTTLTVPCTHSRSPPSVLSPPRALHASFFPSYLHTHTQQFDHAASGAVGAGLCVPRLRGGADVGEWATAADSADE